MIDAFWAFDLFVVKFLELFVKVKLKTDKPRKYVASNIPDFANLQSFLTFY